MAEGCNHPHLDGIDQTPMSDPNKIWVCRACDQHLRAVCENGYMRHELVSASADAQPTSATSKESK